MVGDLRWAGATVNTIRGPVSSSWTHSDGKTTLEMTVPVGSEAEAVIPEDPQMVQIAVLESGRPIWQGGMYVPGDEGVQDARKVGHLVTVKVGSGHYSFQLVSQW